MLGKGLNVFWGLWLYPCRFLWTAQIALAPLELVLRISLGWGPAMGSTIYPSPSLIVFGVCFIGLGRRECRGDVEQKHSM